MPEGDTIHRTAAALRMALLGKPMTAFEAPRLTGAAPAVGSVVERVESWGKHLEIGFDDGVVLHTHMRMSGSWHLYHPGQRWRKSARAARVVIEVPGWQAVCFSAPVVETYRNKELTRHPLAGSLGPDLCQAEADLGACVERMSTYVAPETTLAEVLLDQRIACGVGNVYKSEVLWAVGVHPLSQVGAVDPETRRALIDTAARLLRANLGGPERMTVPGGLAVYGRTGKPCQRCGAPIEIARHGEQARVTYWCPGCQTLARLPGEAAAEPDDEAEPSPRPYEIPRPWRAQSDARSVPRARLSLDWDEDEDSWEPLANEGWGGEDEQVGHDEWGDGERVVASEWGADEEWEAEWDEEDEAWATDPYADPWAGPPEAEDEAETGSPTAARERLDEESEDGLGDGLDDEIHDISDDELQDGPDDGPVAARAEAVECELGAEPRAARAEGREHRPQDEPVAEVPEARRARVTPIDPLL